jgi:Uncharacterized protein conserved in bacteria
MVTIEEMEIMLDEIAIEIPQELYRELNGGIMLLPESKLNPAGRNNELYILGEYHKGGGLGRFITIYYGSFMQVYGYLGKESMKEQLKKTLKHEFIHHIESLAGEKGLEIKDAQFIAEYLKRT